MAKLKPAFKYTKFLQPIVSIVLLTALLYLVRVNWHIVKAGVSVLQQAHIAWFGLAMLLTVGTFCIAAAVYGVVALHRLRYWQTLVVEVASAFVNRLLPSGLGSLGLHGDYLYRRGHTTAEATAVVSINNLIGMVAHALLLGIAIILYPSAFNTFWHEPHMHLQLALSFIGLLVVVICSLFPAVRHRVARFIRNLVISVRSIEPVALLYALLLALLLTVTYTGVLWCTTNALSIHLGVVQVFIIFSLGILGGTVAPTPGGLIGTEAGLFGGLVGYGLTSSSAIAVVTLYRCATYWLPLLPGLVAVSFARRQKLL